MDIKNPGYTRDFNGMNSWMPVLIKIRYRMTVKIMPIKAHNIQAGK
jgi:hypothetical protein